MVDQVAMHETDASGIFGAGVDLLRTGPRIYTTHTLTDMLPLR